MNSTLTFEGTVLETLSIAGFSVEHSIPADRHCTVPVVFVHGMWCSGSIFRPIMSALGALGYECYALSLRGHGPGEQPHGLGKIGISDYIADVEIFLKALNVSVILIGHSMGALIAAKWAERNPSSVKASVSVTSAPPRGVVMGLQTVLRMPKYLWKMLCRKSVMLSPDDSRALLFNRVSDHQFVRLQSDLCAESGTAALEITLWKFDLKPLHCPALVIGGEFDQITPNQKGVAKRLGADFEEVPCGHMVMNDPNLGSVVEIIHIWLGQHIGEAFV